jgi:quaternary ammonium compound-resistance protein SugE
MLPITSTTTAWIVLVLAGALEIVFSITLKLSNGFTRPWLSVVSIVAAASSVWSMSQTLNVLPLGTAYAVWAGLGAAGTAAVGIQMFGEPANPARLACLALVFTGIVGLQLQSTG